jgi:hypothetical protein
MEVQIIFVFMTVPVLLEMGERTGSTVFKPAGAGVWGTQVGQGLLTGENGPHAR